MSATDREYPANTNAVILALCHAYRAADDLCQSFNGTGRNHKRDDDYCEAVGVRYGILEALRYVGICESDIPTVLNTQENTTTVRSEQ